MKELWSRLESRFGESLKIRQYERLLATRVRRHDESLTDLADDIRKMSLIVFHGINYHAQERLTISYFTRALPDVDIDYDISQQQPATLDEPLLIAQNREMYFNPENEHSSTLSNISAVLSSIIIGMKTTHVTVVVQTGFPWNGTNITRTMNH